MQAYPWREVEIRLTAERDYPNPYTDIAVSAVMRPTAADSTVEPRQYAMTAHHTPHWGAIDALFAIG